MTFEVYSNPNHSVMSFLPFVVWTQDKSLIYHQNYVGMIKHCQQHCPFLSSFLSSDSCTFLLLYATVPVESAEDSLILDIVIANSLFDSFISGPLYTLANCINNNSFYWLHHYRLFSSCSVWIFFLLTSIIIHTHGKCFCPSGFRFFFFFFFVQLWLWVLPAFVISYSTWCAV